MTEPNYILKFMQAVYGMEGAERAMSFFNQETTLKDATEKIAHLQVIVDKLRSAELSQTRWEDGEDIVLLDGRPIGGTITSHSREFPRWWPSVKKALLDEAAAIAKATETDDD